MKKSKKVYDLKKTRNKESDLKTVGYKLKPKKSNFKLLSTSLFSLSFFSVKNNKKSNLQNSSLNKNKSASIPKNNDEDKTLFKSHLHSIDITNKYKVTFYPTTKREVNYHHFKFNKSLFLSIYKKKNVTIISITNLIYEGFFNVNFRRVTSLFYE